MTSLYGRYFDASRFGAPYDTPDEHVLDMVCRCQMVLYAYLSCLDDGRTEVLEQLRRLTAPPGGVQALFDKPPALAEVRGDVLRDLDKAQFHIDARTEASVRRGDFLAVQYVREVFRLTDLELFCLTLELLPAYDARLERPLAFLRRGSERGAGADLAVRLYHFAEGAAGLPGYHRICSELSEKAALASLHAGGGIDARIADFILQNGEARLDKNIAEVFIPGELGELPLREHRARELADAMRVSPATIAVSLKSLEREGYVEKRGDPADQRRKAVRLTKKGEDAVRTSFQAFQAVDEKMFRGFTPAEIAQATAFHRRMLQNLRGELPPERMNCTC